MLLANSVAAQLSLPGLDAAPTDRLFFAIRPDPLGAHRATEIAGRLRSQHALEGKPFGMRRLHVSLHFLGAYAGLPRDIVARGCDAAASLVAAPFEISFDRAGSFAGGAGQHPLVLFARRAPASLIELRRAIGEVAARAGLRGRGPRTYTPHMTLLYDARSIEGCAVEPVSWTAREFVLIHSLVGRGRHIALGCWPLDGRD
jgi:RNA 2',3'-cyclic 3'-phosphodiesterase